MGDQDDDEADCDDLWMPTQWDASKYINVHVFDMNGSPLGQANFAPSSNNPRIFVHYTGMGTLYPTLPRYDLSGTLAHEIGHVLGLHHTFRFTSLQQCKTPEEEVDRCSSQGDKICDTSPTTGGAACSFGTCPGFVDQRNIMDYIDDHCGCEFTPMQIEAMRTVAMEDLPGALTGEKFQPTSPFDLRITEVENPVSDSNCGSPFAVDVYVKNKGLAAVSGFGIRCSMGGGETDVLQWSGLLDVHGEAFITTDRVFSASGSITCSILSVTSPDEPSSPEDPAGNSLTRSVTVDTQRVRMEANLVWGALEPSWWPVASRDEEGDGPNYEFASKAILWGEDPVTGVTRFWGHAISLNDANGAATVTQCLPPDTPCFAFVSDSCRREIGASPSKPTGPLLPNSAGRSQGGSRKVERARELTYRRSRRVSRSTRCTTAEYSRILITTNVGVSVLQ